MKGWVQGAEIASAEEGGLFVGENVGGASIVGLATAVFGATTRSDRHSIGRKTDGALYKLHNRGG